MDLLFFYWDYFPFGGFTREMHIERQVRKMCRERSDGTLDYFPRGFGEPGYQIDKARLAEIAAALATLGNPSGRFLWVLAIFMIAFLLIFRPVTSGPGAFVNGLAGGALLFPFLLPLMGSRRSWRLRHILGKSPARVAEFSVEERRNRNLQLWHQTSALTHCIEFLCLGLLGGVAAWMTKLIFSGDFSVLICASAWVPVAASGYALITILRYGELALASATRRAPAT